jgi:hypothetical protein
VGIIPAIYLKIRRENNENQHGAMHRRKKTEAGISEYDNMRNFYQNINLHMIKQRMVPSIYQVHAMDKRGIRFHIITF